MLPPDGKRQPALRYPDRGSRAGTPCQQGIFPQSGLVKHVRLVRSPLQRNQMCTDMAVEIITKEDLQLFRCISCCKSGNPSRPPGRDSGQRKYANC